jgi:hypothetical protein
MGKFCPARPGLAKFTGDAKRRATAQALHLAQFCRKI